MTDTIAAVVVTYNRKQLLAECLDALLNQTRPVQKIIVIDNASSDGTPEFLRENGYLDNATTEYVRLPENTGGAGGFYEGVKRGQEAGYDWLWLMDDDAEPELDAVEILARYFNQENVVALANLKIGRDGIPQYGHSGWLDLCFQANSAVKSITEHDLKKEIVVVDFSSFVGILLKTSALYKAGLPRKDFFIHHDDIEYCYRLKQHGRLLLLPQSRIIHKDQRKSTNTMRTFLRRRSLRIPYDKLWIDYYGYRNMAWLKKRYCSSGLAILLSAHVRKMVGILLYDDHKYRRIRFYSNALYDGLVGRFDNNRPKQLL